MWDIKNIEQRLAESPFLKGMEDHQIKVLAQSATPTAGEVANGFYLIERGNVVVEAPQNRPPPFVFPGSCFGSIARKI